MNELLFQNLMKLPKVNLINLMDLALDEMQSYNGQTKLSSIMRALDAEEIEYRWKLPSIKKMKEATKDGCLFE